MPMILYFEHMVCLSKYSCQKCLLLWIYVVYICVWARMLMQLYDLTLTTFVNLLLVLLMREWHPCLLLCFVHPYPMCICQFLPHKPTHILPMNICSSHSAYQYVFRPSKIHIYVWSLFPHEYLAYHCIWSRSMLFICIDLIYTFVRIPMRLHIWIGSIR